MTNQVGVYNMALGRLGVSEAVTSPSQNTLPAQLCTRFYDTCRQEVLRAHPWSFALRAEQLAEVDDQTFPGWAYVYEYPDECLNMRCVGDESGMRQVYSLFYWNDPTQWTQLRQVRQPWQIALKDDGASQVILSDVPDAWGFHTTDVTNTNAWSADFASVLAWRLAMEVGGPIQANAQRRLEAEQRYASWFSAVSATNMNEQKDDAAAESNSITCRY